MNSLKRRVVNHESEVPPMQRIGVIGGFGQWATQDIIERILRYSAYHVPQYGNRGYPPMDIRMVNRAPMKLNPDGSYPVILEPSPELLEAARFVGTNSDFLILPSHTAHIFAREVVEAAGKPLLSIVDVAIEEVMRRGSKHVGVMAIGLTLGKQLYQQPLEQRGVNSVTLPQQLSQRLDDEGVYQIQEGARVNEVGRVAFEAVDYLRAQNVDSIILGCTEIPILLGNSSDEIDIVNPSQLLAEAAVIRALKKHT